ncbi:GerAB/ArcD/ProY family transporter [Paenibacillus sp. UNC499MF]|uniref:GerAB/ArcD/ProY family transporter n=1 Tax=Paenibacillus sp. UNC499MF TaxID=1502751 RepID=UPI00089FAB6C|nr:GerAB/ArcD/ProY family transporter [Paenibacillus sp. UNC499MF]SEF67897.1 spore germination protein (amino acid permease) [Paenibacillus sp. UNC499MF]
MSREKLYTHHAGFLVFNTQMGVVFFTLPRIAATHFGTNGWASMLFVGVLVTFNIYLISLVNKHGKGASFFEIVEKAIPAWLLAPLYLFMTGVFSMIGCLVVKQYALIYQLLIFPSTPDMVLKMVLDILVLLLLLKGIYTISKANIIFCLLLLLLAPIFVAFTTEFDSVRLTTSFFQDGESMASGFVKMYSAFMGYEVSLFLIPYASRSVNWMKGVYLGNFVVMFVYMMVTFICYGVFSYIQLKHQSFPLLDLLAYVKFPFMERVQNFLYSVFLISVIVTASMYFWSGKETLARLAPKVNAKYMSTAIVLVTFFISYIPKTLITVEKWFGYLSVMTIFLAFFLPVFALVVLLFRKRRGANA